MQVILLKDIPKVGRKYEVKEVSEGYARNFLIPRRLVEPATKEKMASLGKQISAHASERAVSDELLKGNFSKLHERVITIHAKANEQGHLFKGIHREEIAEALATAGFPVEEGYIELEQPLKTVGEHTVTLNQGEMEATITVSVLPEEA